MPKTVLRGITWKNTRGYNPLAAAADVWANSHPEVKIVWDQLPWYEFEQQILESFADGDCPYDLIMFDHPWTGKMAKEQWLIPWEILSGKKYVTDLHQRVVSPSTESYALYGFQWALPLDASCHAGLFRNDLVAAGALPTTWEGMAQWAAQHHNPPHCHALALSLEGVLGTCLFLSMMAGLGFPPYADEKKPVCNREAAAYILMLLKDLLLFTAPGSTSLGPWDIYERFCSGDDILYCPSIFAYVNYFGQGARRENLRLCQVPGFANGRKGKPILGGVGLGIAHSSLHKEAAKSFGEFLMSETVQRDIFPIHCGQPATRAAWMDPEINRTFHNFYTDLHANMATAYIRPRYPEFHCIELGIGKILQHWWNQDMDLSKIINLLNNFK